jgi:hypothetical protein
MKPHMRRKVHLLPVQAFETQRPLSTFADTFAPGLKHHGQSQKAKNLAAERASSTSAELSSMYNISTS